MQLKYIDLFAGLGGFHLALKTLGHECVFASELKEDLRKLYRINFPDTEIYGDITKIDPQDIPAHDLLCGGFPCQPFSQAGKQQGFQDDKQRGNLFYYICDIIKVHRPKFVFLENVANLERHDAGRTWSIIRTSLEDLGYEVKKQILSPHQFGIPQHRRRIYIVAVRKDLGTLTNFSFPVPNNKTCDINTIIDTTDIDIVKIKPKIYNILDVWQDFLDLTYKHDGKIPSFPIWAMEFGATYEFKELAPAYQSVENFIGKKGKLGKRIKGETLQECLSQLPIYAQSSRFEHFPNWKIRYIEQNREFYIRNKSWLDQWLVKVKDFENSHLKLEWNCGNHAGIQPDIYKNILQFRASGIRVKLPTYSPALNLVGTQIPIIPWIKIPESILKKDEKMYGRYLSVKEAAKLQGMEELSFGNSEFVLPRGRAYEALGNAVNVRVIIEIAKNLLSI